LSKSSIRRWDRGITGGKAGWRAARLQRRSQVGDAQPASPGLERGSGKGVAARTPDASAADTPRRYGMSALSGTETNGGCERSRGLRVLLGEWRKSGAAARGGYFLLADGERI
jgi:hypothetical protein